MAIAYRAQAVATGTSGSVTITKPTGTASGDVLLACIARESSVGAMSSIPTGWEVLAQGGGQDQCTLIVLAKTAGGSEPADYTFTTTETIGDTQGAIMAYSGAGGVGARAPVAGHKTQTTGTFPAIETLTDNAMVIRVAAADDNGFGGTTPTPTGHTIRVEEQSDTSGAYVSLFACEKAKATAGTEAELTYTLDNSQENVAVSLWLWDTGEVETDPSTFPFVRGSCSSHPDGNQTDTQVTVPRVKSGDLLVCVVTAKNGSTRSFSAPTGWTEQEDQGDVSGSTMGCAIHTRTATGGESVYYDFPCTSGADNDQSAVMFSIGNVDTDWTNAVVSHSDETTADTSYGCPDITSTEDNSIILRTISYTAGHQGYDIDAADEFVNLGTSGSTSASTGVSYSELATAGSTGTATFTGDQNARSRGYTIALGPATGLSIAAPHIAATSTLYAPSVSHGSAQSIAPGVISSTALYEPSLAVRAIGAGPVFPSWAIELLAPDGASITDTFSRPDGTTLGREEGPSRKAWTTQSGTVELSSNTITSSAGAGIATVDAGSKTVEVTATVSAAATVGEGYVVLLFADTDNYVIAGHEASNTRVYAIWKRIGGTWTLLDSVSGTPVTGEWQVTTAGTNITWYANGTQVLQTSITSGDLAACGTGVGFGAYTSETNFALSDLVARPTPAVLDTFSRSDSTSLGEEEGNGLTWTEQTGDAEIAGGAIKSTGVGTTIATVDAGTQTVDITVDSVPPTISANYVVLCYGDSNNYLLAGREASLGYTWRIWSKIAGTWTAHDGVPGPVSADTSYRVVASTVGKITTVRIVVDGATQASTTLEASQMALLGTECGFYWWTTETASFDNLTVRTAGSEWKDITADVIGPVTAQRGRQDPFGPIPAGTLTLGLEGPFRRYDPTHRHGPYYGALEPGAQVRVVADGEWPIWRGRVRGWPVDYGLGAESPMRVQLTLTDELEDLAGLELPSPWSQRAATIRRLHPRAWYRFSETAGGIMVDSSPNHRDGLHYEVGSVLLGLISPILNGSGIGGRSTTGLIAHDSSPGLAPGGPAEDYIGYPHRQALASQSQWAVECWFRSTDTDGGVIWSHRDGETRQARLYIGSTTQPNGWSGELIADLTNGTSTTTTLIHSGVDVLDGAPHHVIFQRQQNFVRLFLDGVQVDSASVVPWGWTAAGAGSASDHRVGWNAYQTGGNGTTNVFPGTIDELFLWGSDVAAFPMTTAARDRHELGTVGYGVGRTVTAALDRFRDDILPGYFGDTDWSGHTTTTVDAEQYDGMSALEWLRTVANTLEDGRVFVAGDGDITVSDVAAAHTSSHLTISDDGGDTDAARGEAPIRVTWDHGWLRNRVEISNPNGQEVTATDDTSIALYGRKTMRRTAIPNGTTAARTLADALVARWKDPIGRIETVTMSGPHLSDSDRSKALALELGDPVAVRIHPGQVGDAATIQCRVEGIRHEFDATDWRITLSLSPISVGAVDKITAPHITTTTVLYEPVVSTGTPTQNLTAGLGSSTTTAVYEPTLTVAGASNVVSITGSDNPIAIMAANPPGTRYEFAASTTWTGYGELIPKDGDQLVGLGTGATRATLDGTGSPDPWAITGDATNVLIDNLIIQDYNGVPIWGANAPRHQGVIHAVSVDAGNNPVAYASDWTIRNCDITNGEGSAITAGDRFEIHDNLLENNGMAGISAGDFFGGWWHHNDITGNNHATNSPNTGDYNYAAGAEYTSAWNAAGIKVAVVNARGYFNSDFTAINPGVVDTTNRLIIEHNHVHDNEGVGIWLDVACHGVDVIDNLIEDNRTTRAHGEYIGIFVEISRDITVTDNLIRGHATASSGWITPTEFYIWSAQQVTAAANYVDVRHFNTNGRNVFTCNGRPRREWVEEWKLADVDVSGNTFFYTDVEPRCGVTNDDDNPTTETPTTYFQTANLSFLANKWLTAVPTNGGCWWRYAPPYGLDSWTTWTTAQPTGAGATPTTHSDSWPSWSL